jgi:hypothetical protein
MHACMSRHTVLERNRGFSSWERDLLLLIDDEGTAQQLWYCV